MADVERREQVGGLPCLGCTERPATHPAGVPTHCIHCWRPIAIAAGICLQCRLDGCATCPDCACLDCTWTAPEVTR